MQEAEAGGFQVLDQLGLDSEFVANLGHTIRPCLKKNKRLGVLFKW
jgi:hypothetical protein